MITVPAGIRVLVATKPVDFRRGADGLAALVREQLKQDPFSSGGSSQDPGLGRVWTCAALEAA